jgi:Ca2+-binding RTX toxin-like protein
VPGDFEVTVTATDHAGNQTVRTHGYSVVEAVPVDLTPPTVTLTTPAEGATYRVGQVVTAAYTCADEGGSGVVFCGHAVSGPSTGPSEFAPVAVPTSIPGVHTISVTAQDGGGNATLVAHTYTVVRPVCAGRRVTVMLSRGDRPTSGSDVILGTTGADTINAGNGNDTVCGLGGNDRLNGGNGNDKVVAAGGNDTANGGAGNDTLDGGAGSDTVLGGAGNDAIAGGAQRDTCKGQAGSRDTQTGCEVRTGFP